MTTEVEKANNDNLVTETFIVKPENIDELCRLCANTDNQLMPIFSGEGLEHKIINKIRQHLPIIKVTEKDRLPLSICYHCASNLIAWHSLYEGCKLADTRLRELIGEKDGKKNIENDDVQSDKRSYDSFDYDSVHIAYDEDSNDNEISRSEVLEDIIQVTSANTDAKKADGNYKPILEDVAEVVTPDEATLEEDDMITGDIEVDDGDSNIIIETEGLELENLTEEQRSDYAFIEELLQHHVVFKLDNDDVFQEDNDDVPIKQECDVVIEEQSDNDEIISEEPMPMCKLCYKTFSTPFNLSKHISSIHSDKPPFECEICLHPFNRKDNMLYHMRSTHSKKNDRPFRARKDKPRICCHICGKPFISKFSLNQHLVSHSGQKSMKCDICSYKSYTKTQLDIHKAKHNKRFCCEKCSKMFAYKFQLETHLQGVHYNLRPYKCDVCGKSFKTKYNLGSHVAMHNNVRNYRCTYCSHKCRTNYDLTIHIRTHTREKPYPCSECGRCFNQKGDRAKHEKLHLKYRQKSQRSNQSRGEIYLSQPNVDNIIQTEEINLIPTDY